MPLPRTFAQLVDPTIGNLDLARLLEHLSSFYLQLFDVVSSAVMFRGTDGLQLLHASDDALAALEVFQIAEGEGPSLAAFSANVSCAVPDMGDGHEWGAFRDRAGASGFGSFYAFPLQFRGVVVGTLDLVMAEAAHLSNADLHLGQALADVLAVAIIQNFAVQEAHTANGHLQQALSCRVAIEQAKGILAERHRLDVDTAFSALRRYARDTNQRLGTVSNAVIDGRLHLDLPSDPVAEGRR